MEQSSKSVPNGVNKLEKQDSINNRFARYVDRVRNLEAENRERCLKEAEDQLAEQHEVHANAIQELREKYENQMKSNREEIEAVYSIKIKAAQDEAQRNKVALSDMLKELKIAQDRIDDNNGKTVILEQINLSLHNRIRELQLQLDNERSRSTRYHAEIDRVREEMTMHLDEHRELMNTKQSLSREILLYEQLLSDAEKAFRSPTTSDSMSDNRKRKNFNLSARE